jgi:hypothetical protein
MFTITVPTLHNTIAHVATLKGIYVLNDKPISAAIWTNKYAAEFVNRTMFGGVGTVVSHNKLAHQKICHQCSVVGTDFKKCSRCLNVFYCGKKCQVQNWTSHKIQCGKPLKKDTSIVPATIQPARTVQRDALLAMNRKLTGQFCFICRDRTFLKRTPVGILCTDCIAIQKSM